MNEVVEGPLEVLSRVAQAPYPPVARHAEETTHGARLVAVVDHSLAHRPAAFAGSWVGRVPAQVCVLCPADGATLPAFSSPVDFCRRRAGNIKDARHIAASAEQALYSTSTTEPSGALPQPTTRCRIEK